MVRWLAAVNVGNREQLAGEASTSFRGYNTLAAVSKTVLMSRRAHLKEEPQHLDQYKMCKRFGHKFTSLT